MASDVDLSVMSHRPLAVYRCSPGRQRQVQFISDAALEITGYRCQDLLQQSLNSLVFSADWQQIEPVIDQALQNRQDFRATYQLVRADGTFCQVLDQGQGIYTSTGELIAIVGALTDVSTPLPLESLVLTVEAPEVESNQLELDQLALQQPLYPQQIITKFFCLRVNLDGTVKEEGDAEVTAVHSLHKSSRSLEDWLVVVHPEDRPWVQESLQDSITDNQGRTLEYRFLESNGMTRWVQDRLEPEWDVEQQRVTRLLGVTQDITNRKIAETASQNLAHRYQSLIQNVPAILFRDLRNPNWKVTFLSEQVKLLCGYDATDFTYYGARSWTGLIHPEDQPFLSRQIETALAERRPYTLEYRIQHLNGSMHWVQERGQGIFSAQGELLSIDGMLIDISDRKQAEARSRLQSERERLLGAIAIRIRQSLKLPEILQATVDEILGFLGADRVEIACCNTNGVYQVVAESVKPEWSSLLGRSLQEAWFWERLDFYRQGYYEIVHDMTSQALSGELHAWMEQWQIKSRLAVPILSGKQFWGIIAIHQCSENRNWQKQEISLMEQLANQVGIAIQQAELYRRLEIANRQLEQLAFLDGLTQIANRRRFDEYLEREWRRLRREQVPLSLILCDVDYFKRYNDTYGHPKGDECLQQIARVLEQVSQRPADLAARYGGEEFALILPCTDAAGASQIVESIQERIRNLRIMNVSSYITLSFGVTSAVPSDVASIQTLIASADLALYQAKASGKNRYIVNLVEY
jgi:diguanylate cyclase (GGDEF)-like protein/PAS domain S-box-containing protein